MGTIIGEGITFDDVLLVPAYSEVIPNQVNLSLDKFSWKYPAHRCLHLITRFK